MNYTDEIIISSNNINERPYKKNILCIRGKNFMVVSVRRISKKNKIPVVYKLKLIKGIYK